MIIKRIFKQHYSIVFPIVADVIAIHASLFILSFLNGAKLILIDYRSYILYTILSIGLIFFFRGYQMLLRFTTFFDLFKITLGLFTSTVIFGLIINIHDRNQYNYLLLLFYFSVSTLIFYRFIIRFMFKLSHKENDLIPTLIFGANTEGVFLKRALENSNTIQVVGFIDVDDQKLGRTIDGKRVFRLDKKMTKRLKKLNIKQIIVSSSNLESTKKEQLLSIIDSYELKVFTIPSIDNWVSETSILSQLKLINLAELLKRDKIEIDIGRNQKEYENKTILITGAAGSIGSEIVRQLLNFSPKKLILLDIAETPLFHLKNELLSKDVSPERLEFCLDTILNKKSIANIFDNNNIDIVFHAAAYKHVFMMESCPSIAVLNNVLGTKNIVDLCIENKVPNFVLISSDKAVNPSNIMGASKRLAEIYVASIAKKNCPTKFITTRFGNVLGSNGSVIPIFKQQIEDGGPVTVTHKDITRYFMTISEACQLVLEANATGEVNDIFVFDMGEPVKIYKLAKRMIRLCGYKVNEDIKIEITGLRPGEKLYEELLTDQENLKPSHNKLLFIAQKEVFQSELIEQIEKLIEMAKKREDDIEIVRLMKKIIPEFKSTVSKYTILDAE